MQRADPWVLRRRGLLMGLPAVIAASPAWAEWLRDGIVVYADPALRPVLAVLFEDFRRHHPGLPRVFAAAPTQMLGLLAHGTQADILLTQTAYMDQAQAASLIVPARRTLWRNRLVLAGRKGAFPAQAFAADALARIVGGGAIAAPDATSAASVDGMAALQSLGVTAKLQGTADTGDGLDMLRAGTVALALCHASELAAQGWASLVMALPDASYPPIIYQAALTTSAWSRHQQALLDYLGGDARGALGGLGLEAAA